MGWPEFFAMGGYGSYIWASYALAATVLVVNVLLPLRRRKTVRRQLKEYYRLRRQSQ